jgi:pimeloyl-ACP methyl ester carboxylesterase
MPKTPSPVTVRSGTFRHEEYELAYEIWGDKGVPCILIHGLLLDALVNRGIAQRFAAEGFQVVLLDLLGHGKSDRTKDPKDHRVDFYAEQILGVMDHLGFEKALVGGVSLGSMTSLEVAAQAPNRLLGLFLEMPVMEWSAPWAGLIFAPLLFGARFFTPFHRALARFFQRLPRPRADWLASVMNAASQEPEHASAVLHGLVVGPIVPTEAKRRAIKVPTLIIGHSGDKLHEHRDSLALAAQISGSKLVWAKHILELRLNPERLWPDISDFLADVRAQAEPRRKPARTQVKARKPARGGK